MKYYMETFTRLTKILQDLNQETRQKLSSMPSYTEQETKRLEKSLEEVEKKVRECESLFSIVSHHLTILRTELNQQRGKGS